MHCMYNYCRYPYYKCCMKILEVFCDVQVQPAVAYSSSILVLLPKPLDGSSDSFINIAEIDWVVSEVAIATHPLLYLHVKQNVGSAFV